MGWYIILYYGVYFFVELRCSANFYDKLMSWFYGEIMYCEFLWIIDVLQVVQWNNILRIIVLWLVGMMDFKIIWRIDIFHKRQKGKFWDKRCY